jgi:TPR repeat protein
VPNRRIALKLHSFFFIFYALGACPPLFAQEFDDPSQTSLEAKDYNKVFHQTKIDAERGDPKAAGNLGLLYQKGLGTPANNELALQWLTRAAKKGDASAQNNLGFLYFKGLGVKPNYAQALKWFQKAADQDLASAETNLGLMYGEGLGVSRDYAKAFAYFKKAAEQDDLDAQVNLGMMYSLGEGTSQNDVEAYKWFYLALQHAIPEDEKRTEIRDDIQWLEKHMKNEDIDLARQEASAWKPAPSGQNSK